MPDPHLKKIPRAELGDDLAPLWDAAMRDRNEATLFDDRERAVLRLCEELTLANMDGYMDRHLYDALSEHFDDGEIFELGVCLAVLVGMAKFLFVFDLVSREDNCPIAPPGRVSAE